MPSTTYVSTGASQSLAENGDKPSLLSCGMFADLRQKNTAPTDKTAIAKLSARAGDQAPTHPRPAQTRP